MELKFLYITVTDLAEAKKIATALLEERLIACANIYEGVTSLYRWQGKIQSDSECVVFAKTTKDQAKAAVQKVKELHSYECPCVVALSIDQASEEFAEWVHEQTSS